MFTAIRFGYGHVFVCRRTYCFLPPTPKTTGLSPDRQLKVNEKTRFSSWLKWSALIRSGRSPLVCPDATIDPLRKTNIFDGGGISQRIRNPSTDFYLALIDPAKLIYGPFHLL
jgi:hypothetical protein